ncbi:hypothetical protein [Sphingomonas parapaucimobilis]|jgi:hypothetical protein|uniref:hypothetical protein n=1 Tax=Sphingomonas parapaucimobilis TaxID=28213 RepID=UPI00321A2008
MRRSTGFLGAGIIGALVLGGSVAGGYLDQRFKPHSVAKQSFGQGASPAQEMERRRGRAATVAIAEAAVR